MDNFSKQIYEAGINDGRAEGKAEGKAESIKNLMSTMNVSIDQAMDILKTPPEEHQYFKDLLAYEIEIQKADGGIAHEKRMLYYASTIINEYFFKGDQTYASVPELHIFYISQTDIWKLGKTCYPILKFLGDTNTPYNDGLHMCYINAEVDDNSSIAQLMQYFATADAGDFSQGKLSQCINNLKTTKEGLATMDNFSKQIYEAGINDGRAEGKAEGKAESIKNLMSTMNVSIDQAMDILKTPPEEHQYFKDLLAKEQ